MPKQSKSGSQPEPPVELRLGLPTGSGGPIGQENAGTWSLAEQEREFGVHQSPQPQSPPPATEENA